MKLWFVIYVIHTAIFSTHIDGDDMGRCNQRIESVRLLLERAAPKEPVNVNIAPQYRKTETPERTMFCMWSEKDPVLK